MSKTVQPRGADGRKAGSGAVSRTTEEREKRTILRIDLPAVLDDALTQYAHAVALGKGAAARTILMRVLVKRTMRVPEPAHDGA